jgi:hypothetical protein
MRYGPSCAAIYFEQVAKTGSVLHLLFTDKYFQPLIEPALRQTRDRVLRRLARLGRKELGLSPKESVSALAIALAIPEELGRLVFRGDLEQSRARELCLSLITSSVRGLARLKP